MLSQTSRYALSLLCYLARQRGERVPAQRIALDTGAPANYVGKILGVLRKGGVVDGEKGWRGGYALRPEAKGVSVGEVMALFEEKVGPVACPFVQPECGCYLALHGEERVPITLAAVAGREAGETKGADTICPHGGLCTVVACCPVHGYWARVREGFWGLARTTVGELVEGGRG